MKIVQLNSLGGATVLFAAYSASLLIYVRFRSIFVVLKMFPFKTKCFILSPASDLRLHFR